MGVVKHQEVPLFKLTYILCVLYVCVGVCIGVHTPHCIWELDNRDTYGNGMKTH